MPVGKPTPDGEIVMGSRHYGGAHGRLAAPLADWDCPACGMKNQGRAPEQGCVHCEAGDPRKSQAGSAKVEPTVPELQVQQRAPRNPGAAPLRPVPVPSVEPQTLRVLRLIEYLINPGEDADLTLRNSLVGRMDFAWGTLTGTIVDSCDARQEDLLGLARRQPGVWLGNQEAMTMVKQPSKGRPGPAPAAVPRRPVLPEAPKAPAMEMPPTGPPFGEEEAKFAAFIAETYDLRFAHTLALALSQIAPELAANMEPEKFLSDRDCLRFANALMQRIPEDWKGDQPLVDESEAPPQTIGDA